MEADLATAKTTAAGMLETAKTTLNTAFSSAMVYVDTIKAVLNVIPGFDAAYENAKQEMKKDFKTYFASNDQFKDFVGQGHWGKAA